MTDTVAVPHPTMLSVFIRELQAIKDEHGDMPICAKGWDYTTAWIGAYVRPASYDGGCLMPVKRSGVPHRWVKSRNQPWWTMQCYIDTNEPEPALPDDPVEKRDTIDGVPMPDLKDGE